jgi:tripeptide aminopeptidase
MSELAPLVTARSDIRSRPSISYRRCNTASILRSRRNIFSSPTDSKRKLAGRKIVNSVKTALGGDNRAGCGVLVTLAAELAQQKLDHPPITLLFCVREESGLWGARHVKTADLGSPVMAFNYDGSSASNVTVGAVGADRWQVEIFGRASHAGVAPERGISSTMILALALADVRAGGWFGKVVKGKRQGTSNVGPVTGGDGRPAGDATNVVTLTLTGIDPGVLMGIDPP